MDMTNVLTVKQLAKLNPAFSESTIRWWIFNAVSNGFNECLIRMKRRIYIDRLAFERWLEKHRAAGQRPALA